jgi:hypothetical protein
MHYYWITMRSPGTVLRSVKQYPTDASLPLRRRSDGIRGERAMREGLGNSCIRAFVHPQLVAYKTQTVPATSRLARTMLPTLPCECTAPTVSLPLVSSPAASPPPRRVSTRQRLHQSPLSTTDPRRTIGPCQVRRRHPLTWWLVFSGSAEAPANSLTTSSPPRS